MKGFYTDKRIVLGNPSFLSLVENVKSDVFEVSNDLPLSRLSRTSRDLNPQQLLKELNPSLEDIKSNDNT